MHWTAGTQRVFSAFLALSCCRFEDESTTLAFTPNPTWPAIATVSADLRRYCKDETDKGAQRAIQENKLHVLSQCEVATGIITEPMLHPEDRDYYFDMRLDADYEKLSKMDPVYEELRGNSGLLNRHELIHVEIMPPEQPLAELPTKGMHIVVVGLWVFEGQPLWNEIHPVWFWAEVTQE